MINSLTQTCKTKGLATMRSILHTLDRKTLQDICSQNDHNGVWSDEDNILEFGCVMTDEAYRDIIERWITEDL